MITAQRAAVSTGPIGVCAGVLGVAASPGSALGRGALAPEGFLLDGCAARAGAASSAAEAKRMRRLSTSGLPERVLACAAFYSPGRRAATNGRMTGATAR